MERIHVKVFAKKVILIAQGVHSMNIRVGGGGVPLELQNPGYVYTLLQSRS